MSWDRESLSIIMLKASIFSFLALLGLFGSIGAIPFNARDISRMVATVDPKTCNCVPSNQCVIEVPNVSYIGINCQYGLKVSHNRLNFSSMILYS